MATPTLLSRVIESQGQEVEIVSMRDRVQLTKVGPSTPIVVFGIGDGLWFPS